MSSSQGYGASSALYGARIVEHRDERGGAGICEINAGIYAFAIDGLFAALAAIAGNAQGELRRSIVALYRKRGLGVGTFTVADADEIRGINSRIELAAVSRIVRQTKNQALMAAGVTIEDPATTYVDPHVEVGPDTVIHPGVSLEGRTTIGMGCEIPSGARIVDSTVGDRVTSAITVSSGVRQSRTTPRSLRAPAAGNQYFRARDVGNAERKKTGRAGVEGDYLRTWATRRSVGRQHRRHDHVQLRRRDQAADHD
jgi:bifunctional N-acetylglucosamine-1-phosphate-uridyltransferase/glucosamine-1-phosphate-acetyltransferase GlmU-like protein